MVNFSYAHLPAYPIAQSLNWFCQGFQNPLALGRHVWMAMHDMLPPLLCQTDRNAVM